MEIIKLGFLIELCIYLPFLFNLKIIIYKDITNIFIVYLIHYNNQLINFYLFIILKNTKFYK